MADETPGAMINDLRTRIRAEEQQKAEKGYAQRLMDARAQMRREQDEADAQRICQVEDQQAARLAEYRRGHWYDLTTLATSAAAGFAMGLIVQRNADVRLAGQPVVAVAGLAPIALGTAADENVVVRASLVVGGTMFMVGAYTHTLLNPLPREPQAAQPLKPQPPESP